MKVALLQQQRRERKLQEKYDCTGNYSENHSFALTTFILLNMKLQISVYELWAQLARNDFLQDL